MTHRRLDSAVLWHRCNGMKANRAASRSNATTWRGVLPHEMNSELGPVYQAKIARLGAAEHRCGWDPMLVSSIV